LPSVRWERLPGPETAAGLAGVRCPPLRLAMRSTPPCVVRCSHNHTTCCMKSRAAPSKIRQGSGRAALHRHSERQPHRPSTAARPRQPRRTRPGRRGGARCRSHFRAVEGVDKTWTCPPWGCVSHKLENRPRRSDLHKCNERDDFLRARESPPPWTCPGVHPSVHRDRPAGNRLRAPRPGRSCTSRLLADAPEQPPGPVASVPTTACRSAPLCRSLSTRETPRRHRTRDESLPSDHAPLSQDTARPLPQTGASDPLILGTCLCTHAYRSGGAH
jgi:hypothetical protein